jgi:methyl-accepting chemotaxis protein
MPRKRRSSVAMKFVMLLLLPLIAGIAVMGVTVAHLVSVEAERSAIVAGQDAAEVIGQRMRAGFEDAMATTRTMRDVLVALREAGQLSRPALTSLMQKTLEDNPGIFGIWSCWEPDALDGMDKSYSARPGEVPSGQYAKYVVRSPTGIREEPLEGFEGADPAAYYAQPKRGLVESVVEPYGYQTNGKWSLLTTFSEPIIIGGKFAGAIGADFSLDQIQQTVSGSHPLGAGRVSLISNKGAWISDVQTDQVGKAADANDPSMTAALALVAAGTASVQHASSIVPGEGQVLRVFVPLALGRTKTPWSVMVTLPVASLFGQARELVGIIAGAGAILVIVVCGIVVFTTQRLIGRPLNLIAGRLHQPSGADTVNEAERRLLARNDEIGTIAGAVQSFQDAARQTRAQEQEQARDREHRVIEDERLRREAEHRVAAEAATLIVGSIGAGLERLAAGDLTYRLAAPLPEPYAALRLNLNAAVTQLQQLIGGIAVNTSSIRTGTEEIARSADELSQRTEHQSATLAEAAATLDQITSTVRKTAENATQLQKVVALSKADATKSGVIVKQASAAMSAIEGSSKKISQILGFIDEIAFQTNLLALNAGVEAARAGEAGRGFAVVASEVRALAQRSTKAAQEIETLIAASAQQVGTGVKLVGETDDALARIVAQVGEITAVVSEIAGSASEQATALLQVNTAINQLDNVTQQNATMVQQSRTASHELEEDTKQLVNSTSRFKLDARDTGAAAENHRPARRPYASSRI